MNKDDLKGWICAPEGNRQKLEDMGITLGEYDKEGKSFEDCIVSYAAFENLHPHWGTYLWGLSNEKHTVGGKTHNEQ